MNRYFAAVCLTVFVVCMPLGQAAFVPDERSNAQITEEQKQCKAIVDEVGIGNYEGLSEWLRTHLEYDRSVGNSSPWKYPLDTLTEGKGVCKDYALVAVECLALMGVKDVFFLGVMNKELTSGHAVAIFRTSQDAIWYFYSLEKLLAGPQGFKQLVAYVGYESGYGLHPVYYLFSKDLQFITPEDESNWGL